MIAGILRKRVLGLLFVAIGALGLQEELVGRSSTAGADNAEEQESDVGLQQCQACGADAAPLGAAIGLQEAGESAPPTSEATKYRWPLLLPLTHSKVPVVQNERVVAHKSVYYGRISIGQEPQEFKVVFDTGSAHAIVASISCFEAACKKHQRYNSSASSTAVDVNIDGSWVPHGHMRDTVTVGFGTGSVHADIVREVLCVNSNSVPPGGDGEAGSQRICSSAQVLVARQMSVLFETATFDGIVGLSFPKLALSKEFSFLSCLAGVMGDSGPERFAFFLADDESGRGSELAIGGHNPAHLLSPLSWVPVSDPQDGHWKVAMSAVTISGVQLAACDDGACEGIVDTGTSHLGVPREDLRELVLRLSRPAEETTDCRRVEGDEVVIQLSGLNLTLSPWEYMRPLPLRAGTFLNKDHLEEWVTVPLTNGSTPVEILLSEDGNETVPDSFTCTPRLFPVVLKPGKKIFLLGEPVLQRYYSVFDWGSESIAFGLADQRPQETASNDFDDSTLLQLSVLPEEGTVRVDPKFAVMSGEGLEDATSVSLSLGAAAF